MAFFKTSLIRKLTLFLAAAMLSVSAMATDFNENKRLANQGNASAQYNLGVMYYKGEGVKKDNAKAIEWFKLAANQGHPRSQYNLEAMYSNGESAYPYKIASERISEPVPVFLRSPTTAAAQAIAQAEADIKAAQAAVGIEIAKARAGLKKFSTDLAKGTKSKSPFEAKAKRGDARAQYFFGAEYFGGFGSVKDYKKAFEWWKNQLIKGMWTLNTILEGCILMAMELLGIIKRGLNGGREQLIKGVLKLNIVLV